MNVILASQSPRRRELLGLTGLPFVVRVADIDETMTPGADPGAEVARLSREKALAVPREPDDVVIAADTIVVCDGNILGKPRNAEEAFRMLSMLSGRSHQVMTGVTVLRGGQEITHTEISQVRFRPLSEGEIRAYIATGEPMDKAGSYGIQRYGALFVTGVEGDYFNVVGLPVCALGQMLRRLGLTIMGETA